MGPFAAKNRFEVKARLERHNADFFFDLSGIYHHNRIPGAAVQEASVRPLADTLLTADTEDGIDLNPSERHVVLVRYPEHAVFDGTVFDAGG